MPLITRRRALLAAGGAGLLLPGCSKIFDADKLNGAHAVRHILDFGDAWSLHSQRFLLGGGQLAPEYKVSDLSPVFKANGTLDPDTDAYNDASDNDFVDWRFGVDGLVAHPMSLSVAALRALPARTQITRHDCVEGWSAIGQWKGVPLGLLLKAAGVQPGARYVVFRCADNLEGEASKGGEQAPGQYYESLDLTDAFHPQTLIAYAMNGKPLDVAHGAPLRLRVERQLGYKQAKYLQGVHVTNTLQGIGGGMGGYWEDRGYDWYAGI